MPIRSHQDQIAPIWTRAATYDEPLYAAADLAAICAAQEPVSSSSPSPSSSGGGAVVGAGAGAGETRVGLGSVDMREVLARLVDGSRLKAFKPDYGGSLLCGWAQLEGHPLAVVANADTTLCANGVRFWRRADARVHHLHAPAPDNQSTIPPLPSPRTR